ncbi:transposase [Nocardioides mangrovicus]|uniref:Transposase n=1 Tax=Nocardioides mangrovicus TaxID=2478913 RepID=A0A3L8P1S9_9ACTN|nr:transposase [Nocardioides mangrovicus]RLV48902.1 transposase [Nocardioides mangrovicus]
MLVVVTADQRHSRRGPDRVPAILDALRAVPTSPPHRGFERTAGDEVQGVLGHGDDVVAVLEQLLRHGGWRVGVGVGEVEHPLPRSTRAGRGAAFLHARDAVEAARSQPGRLAVRADDDVAAGRLETVVLLWADLLTRRTAAGWEVADLLAGGLTQPEVANRLGVTQSAVSQRAATAAVSLSVRGGTLAAEMIDELVGGEPA